MLQRLHRQQLSAPTEWVPVDHGHQKRAGQRRSEQSGGILILVRKASRTWQPPDGTRFSGDFTDVFTYSPIGPVEPTGTHIEWEVIGTFRYDDDGRLAEEWVQTDYRSS